MEAYSLRAPVGKGAGGWLGAHLARDEGVAAILDPVLAAALVDVATFATTETSAPLAQRLFRRRLRRRLCSGRGAEIELRHAELG